MKLNALPSEEDGFNSYPIEFCGIESYLIIPDISAKWDKQNVIFRSLIVRGSDFEVLSSNWKKFWNAGEKPDLYPDPIKYRDWSIFEKKDGTAVLVDYVNGQFSMRTRGTPSYRTQDNYTDFELLPETYPKIVEWIKENPNYTLLLELMTPRNVIVIRPSDVEFTLLGAIDKDSLTYMSVEALDYVSKVIEIPTPKQFFFKTIDEIVSSIETIKNFEGVVLSYNKNQNKIKLKNSEYLALHRIKSELSSEKNLLEYYVSNSMPDYNDFFKLLEEKFDYEIAITFQSQISKLADASKEVKRIIKGMEDFVNDIRNLPTRKEQALTIMNSFGGEKNSRASMCFAILDGKELTKDQIQKLFWQTLKQS